MGSLTPLLLLEELAGERVLPIFVGAPEATAIAYALQHLATPRPMSHDLMSTIITSLGGRLFTVEITELIDNTFYANLRILRDASEIVVSARPSDAVALALRAGAPILVSDSLMDEQGRIMQLEDDELDEVIVGESGESDEAELVAELREFLDTIRPEDFNQ